MICVGTNMLIHYIKLIFATIQMMTNCKMLRPMSRYKILYLILFHINTAQSKILLFCFLIVHCR